MNFKGKKQEKIGESNEELSKRLNSDFVVHNMPSPLSSSSETNKANFSAPQNHKKTGIIIIIGGILLIIGLIYGAYILIIKPSLNPSVNPEENLETVNEQASTTENTLTPNQELTVIPSSTLPGIEVSTSTVASTTELETPTSTISSMVVDSDSDGLSDEEEKLLGADSTKIDSDGDGNADLIEIKNNYNPAGTGRLASSSYLASFTNPLLKYSILYPKDWTLKNLNGNETVLTTSVDENYFIQVIHQNNTNNLSILDWFQTEFPEQQMGEARSAADGSWSGVYSEDKKAFYLNDQAKANIYVFSIGAVEGNSANFTNLFELIIDNFKPNATK